MPEPSSFEDRQHDLNPHRDEDRDRAVDVAYAQLRQRGVEVTGDEPAGELASLVSAVERFEDAVSSLGGDRMTNAPDSAQPDDRRLVLPTREKRESVADYAGRVREAADGLLRGGPPVG